MEINQLKQKVDKVRSKLSDYPGHLLVPQMYKLLSATYLTGIIGELNYDNIKNPSLKKQLYDDFPMLHYGIAYYRYLREYAEEKNYDAAVISTIQESEFAFFQLYTGNKNADGYEARLAILRDAMRNDATGASLRLSNGISDIHEFIIGLLFGPVFPNYNCDDNDLLDTLQSITLWKANFMPLAYRFIDDLQKFAIDNDLDDFDS